MTKAAAVSCIVNEPHRYITLCRECTGPIVVNLLARLVRKLRDQHMSGLTFVFPDSRGKYAHCSLNGGCSQPVQCVMPLAVCARAAVPASMQIGKFMSAGSTTPGGTQAGRSQVWSVRVGSGSGVARPRSRLGPQGTKPPMRAGDGDDPRSPANHRGS